MAVFADPDGGLVGGLEAVHAAVAVVVGDLGDEVFAGLGRPPGHAEGRRYRGDHAAEVIGVVAAGADERVDILQDAGVGVVVSR